MNDDFFNELVSIGQDLTTLGERIQAIANEYHARQQMSDAPMSPGAADKFANWIMNILGKFNASVDQHNPLTDATRNVTPEDVRQDRARVDHLHTQFNQLDTEWKAEVEQRLTKLEGAQEDWHKWSVDIVKPALAKIEAHDKALGNHTDALKAISAILNGTEAEGDKPAVLGVVKDVEDLKAQAKRTDERLAAAEKSTSMPIGALIAAMVLGGLIGGLIGGVLFGVLATILMVVLGAAVGAFVVAMIAMASKRNTNPPTHDAPASREER